MHNATLLQCQYEEGQPPAQLSHCLPRCPHLHNVRKGDGGAVDLDCGGRAHEPVIAKTTHDVMQINMSVCARAHPCVDA